METAEVKFTSWYLSAQDGLRLHYRVYGDVIWSSTPILCLPGLTRNAADIHAFASRHASERCVVVLDYRGRGEAAFDPNPRNCLPEVYANDILHLAAAANVSSAIVIGTSLGGLLAMSLAAQRPGILAGVVVNDIGPEIDPSGLDNIRKYLAMDLHPSSWDEAADMVKQISLSAAPDFTENQWLDLARRSFRQDDTGAIRLDFDPALATTFLDSEPVPELWPLFGGLKHIPTLAIRGALSDVLSQQTFEKMAEAKPDLIQVTVPNRGHVPWLDESEAKTAVDEFIAGL